MGGFKKYERFFLKKAQDESNSTKSSYYDDDNCTNDLKNAENTEKESIVKSDTKMNGSLSQQKKSMEWPKLFLEVRGERSVLTASTSRRVSLTFNCIQSLILQSLIGRKAQLPGWCQLLRRDMISQVTVIIVDGLGVSEMTAIAEGRRDPSSEEESDQPPLKKHKKKEEDISQEKEVDLSVVVNQCLPKSCSLFPLQLEVESPTQHCDDPVKELFVDISMTANVVKNVIEAFGSLPAASHKNIVDQFKLKDGEIKPILEKFDPIEKDHKDNMNRLDLLLSVQEMATYGYPLKMEGTESHRDEQFVPLHEAYDEATPTSPMFAIDCEMCKTTVKNELTRVSVVDEKLNVIYTSFVKPRNNIINYLTHWSGITPEHLLGVETSVENVQKKLRNLLPKDCILVGHSLDSDLHALKLFHPYVIDTSRIYNLTGIRGNPSSLKLLTQLFLNKEIQNSETKGHDPSEDAAAALQLALLKLRNDMSFGDVIKGGVPPVSKRELLRTRMSIWKKKDLNRFSSKLTTDEYKSTVFKIIKLESCLSSVITTEQHSSGAFKQSGVDEIIRCDEINQVFEKEATHTALIVRHCRISDKKLKKKGNKLDILDDCIKKVHDSMPQKSLLVTLFTTGSDPSVPVASRSKGILLVDLIGQERQQFRRNL